MKADKAWVIAIAIYWALRKDTALLEKLIQEEIELWNGENI